jgi:fumarylpyruvate hydrolase
LTGYVITKPPRVSLAVEGTTDRFPVRRIWCVGRNYADHVREMGKDPALSRPIFFAKPADAATNAAAIPYPPATAELHHEVELVLAIGASGRNVAEAQARALIWGYAVGIDLTRRDRQAEAKAAGAPWEIAKAFDWSAPLGPIVPAARIGPLVAAAITLSVDGAVRQDSDISRMIWPPEAIIAHLSQLVALAPGDLIMTGTPEGVGPVAPGQAIRAKIEHLPVLEVSITPA